MIPQDRRRRSFTREVRADLIVFAVLACVWWCCPGDLILMAPGLTVVAILVAMVLDAFLWFSDEP